MRATPSMTCWRMALPLLLLGILSSASATVAQTAAGSSDSPPATDFDDEIVYRQYPDPPPDAPEARLRIYFDLVSREQSRSVEPNVPFAFYVVAHDVQIALRGWEARVELDPRIRVLERRFDGLNLGSGDEFLVGLKPKHCKDGETIVLAGYRAMITEAGLNDLVIGLGPVAKSSFDPPRAGYLVCRPGADLRTFDACDTCAVVNPLAIEPQEPTPGDLPPELLKPVRRRD